MSGSSGRVRMRAALVLTLGGWLAAHSAAGLQTDGKGSMYGKRAPDFRIQGVYGETYSLAALRGHVVILQFGTSW